MKMKYTFLFMFVLNINFVFAAQNNEDVKGYNIVRCHFDSLGFTVYNGNYTFSLKPDDSVCILFGLMSDKFKCDPNKFKIYIDDKTYLEYSSSHSIKMKDLKLTQIGGKQQLLVYYYFR